MSVWGHRLACWRRYQRLWQRVGRRLTNDTGAGIAGHLRHERRVQWSQVAFSELRSADAGLPGESSWVGSVF